MFDVDLFKKLSIIFFIIIIFTFLSIKNYYRFGFKSFLDQEFYKPQSFHKKKTLNFGGIVFFFLFNIFSSF